MSAFGARIRSSRFAGRLRAIGAEEANSAVEPAPQTPYRLLWSIGIVAFVLGAFAFALWGINGASTLFDLVVALCT
jgi:hypothetical protein